MALSALHGSSMVRCTRRRWLSHCTRQPICSSKISDKTHHLVHGKSFTSQDLLKDTPSVSVHHDRLARLRSQSLQQTQVRAQCMTTCLEACNEMPVEAASDTMAMSFLPLMNASVSFTFSESSSVLSGLPRSWYTPLQHQVKA